MLTTLSDEVLREIFRKEALENDRSPIPYLAGDEKDKISERVLAQFLSDNVTTTIRKYDGFGGDTLARHLVEIIVHETMHPEHVHIDLDTRLGDLSRDDIVQAVRVHKDKGSYEASMLTFELVPRLIDHLIIFSRNALLGCLPGHLDDYDNSPDPEIMDELGKTLVAYADLEAQFVGDVLEIVDTAFFARRDRVKQVLRSLRDDTILEVFGSLVKGHPAYHSVRRNTRSIAHWTGDDVEFASAAQALKAYLESDSLELVGEILAKTAHFARDRDGCVPYVAETLIGWQGLETSKQRMVVLERKIYQESCRQDIDMNAYDRKKALGQVVSGTGLTEARYFLKEAVAKIERA